MNTQTQEAGYLFDFSKFLFDEHGLIVTDTEMQEIIHEAKKVATQPIAADAEAVLKKHLECSPSKIIQHSYLPAVIAAMKEYASQPKGAGVDWEKLQDSISEIAIEQMNVLEIHKWWDFGDYEEIRGQDSAAFEIGAAVVNYLKSDEFSSLPSQEGQQTK